MGSGHDRYANVLGKPLGPNWRIFRWWRVTVRKPYRQGDDYIDEVFLFDNKARAKEFKARAEKKYPRWKVYCYSVYVLSANNGKTAHELPGRSAERPRATSNVGKLHKPEWVV